MTAAAKVTPIKRKSISVRARFDVFKRDGFVCQYCGRTPPDVVLEVDHIIPVCAGGLSDEENLITACFECNRGKAGNDLSDTPQSLQERAELMAEAETQMQAYARLLAAKKRRTTKSVNSVSAIFRETFEVNLKAQERHSIKAHFLTKLLPDEVEDAMALACSRINNPYRAWKYFCGVCWGKIRDRQDG